MTSESLNGAMLNRARRIAFVGALAARVAAGLPVDDRQRAILERASPKVLDLLISAITSWNAKRAANDGETTCDEAWHLQPQRAAMAARDKSEQNVIPLLPFTRLAVWQKASIGTATTPEPASLLVSEIPQHRARGGLTRIGEPLMDA